jgi:hypothetical protein
VIEDQAQGSTAGAGRLDIRSRRALRGFLVRLVTFALITVGPCLAGSRSLREAGLGFHAICFFGATLACAWAALLREKPYAPSFNFWDEALALVGAGLLVKLLIDVSAT